jgi:rubrerythrin
MDNILRNSERDPNQIQNNVANSSNPKNQASGDEKSIAAEKLGYDLDQAPPEDLDVRWVRWKCLVCGYVYEGAVRLKVCPKCGNEDPDKFQDAD